MIYYHVKLCDTMKGPKDIKKQCGMSLFMKT